MAVSDARQGMFGFKQPAREDLGSAVAPRQREFMPSPIFGGLILGSGRPDITQWDRLFMEEAVTAIPKELGSRRQGGSTGPVLEAEFYIKTLHSHQGGCRGSTNTSNQVILQFGSCWITACNMLDPRHSKAILHKESDRRRDL